MSEWVPVCRDAELGLRQVRVVVRREVRIAVFRGEDGRCYALEDRCPHRGAPLSAGVIYDVCKIACADHGWTIDLASGAVQPPERGQVRTFPVEVCDGQVLVWA